MLMRVINLAFGITRKELDQWKRQVSLGQIAFLTHYWQDKRFSQYSSVTKVGCNCIDTLIDWGNQYQLSPKWIHDGKYPHFDLMGKRQYIILSNEGLINHIENFNLTNYSSL